MTLLRKSILSTAALLATSAASFAAEGDGLYNVVYREFAISLTQVGGFGELQIESNGFKSLSYGACVVNFTRDDAGAIKEMSPVATVNSAHCPDAMKFTLAPSKSGMYEITFTEAGDLTGDKFDLYPVIAPMQDSFKVTAPKGYEILGMTPGMSRDDLEAALQEKGFTKNAEWTSTQSYESGQKRALDVWEKGTADFSADTPEDAINITYNAINDGDAEVALLIGRRWYIPKSANLSASNLKKSLEEKHGAAYPGFQARYYDRAGVNDPKAFQPVCAEDVHLQAVSLPHQTFGQSGTMELAASCGAQADIMVNDSFDTPGAAGQLHITIAANDLVYEDFYKLWAPAKAKELEERYTLQANTSGATPNL